MKSNKSLRWIDYGLVLEAYGLLWLLENRYTFHGFQLETPSAKIDLLVEKKGEIFVVEVKSLPESYFFSFNRITQKQRFSLLKSCRYIKNQTQQNCFLMELWVKLGEVPFIARIEQ